MKKNIMVLSLLLFVTSTVSMPGFQKTPHLPGNEPDSGTAWAELDHRMHTMHSEMNLVRPSGNDDVDFVRLMLPHHQAAIDMAKTELEYGKDRQMRRLALEIITDQQSETELMKLWLKQHASGPQE